MTDFSLTTRLDRDPTDRYHDAEHLDEARRTQQANASGLALPRPLRDVESNAHVTDRPMMPMDAAAFTNPALLRSHSPTAPPADACATAAPVKIVVGPMRRGEDLPKGVDLSCTKKGGLCLTKEETAQLQAARQAACIATGIDPFRLQALPAAGPAVGRDRGWEADTRDMAALRNLELMAQNPFAAAAYGSARVGGASEKTSQNVAQVAGVVGNAAVAIGAGVVAARAARAPAVTRGSVPPLTSTEAAEARAFLMEVKTPAKYVNDTMKGFGAGTRVETLDADVHVFRYHGTAESARGRWVTEEPVNDAIRELALKRADNPATHMTEWIVPAGTKVLRGPVAPLHDQPGGGSQIFLTDPSVLREP
jgi:hypothetical protein